MTDLTVEAIRTPDGYDFLRSDGLHFFLIGKPDGQAVLHLGRRTARPPAVGLVDFEAGLFAKVEAARQWILAEKIGAAIRKFLGYWSARGYAMALSAQLRMSSHLVVLIAALGLCALISHDMTNAIRSGKVRGRTGTIKRSTRPDAFRSYIIAEAIGLALCFGVAIWAVVHNG